MFKDEESEVSIQMMVNDSNVWNEYNEDDVDVDVDVDFLYLGRDEKKSKI